MFSFFTPGRRLTRFPLKVDMHSHLLPGLDDGVKSLEESKTIILKLADLGYERLVTTPHTMHHHYSNTTESILSSLRALRTYLQQERIEIPVDAASEYYLDESVMEALDSGKPLLSFGDRYILFETNYITEPLVLKEFIFKATAAGYKPVMAHPERYQYLSLEKAEDLVNRGVFLQVNLLSFSGFYSPPVQRAAERLVEKKLVSFLGTDCHCLPHADALEAVLKSKGFRKAIDLPLLNSSLLS